MKIVSKAGYHGFVGIEYEGGRLSEPHTPNLRLVVQKYRIL